jgi:hypothetical protein
MTVIDITSRLPRWQAFLVWQEALARYREAIEAHRAHAAQTPADPDQNVEVWLP